MNQTETEETQRLMEIAYIQSNLPVIIEKSAEQFAEHGEGILVVQLADPMGAPQAFWKPLAAIPDPDIRALANGANLGIGQVALALIFPKRLSAYRLDLRVCYNEMPQHFYVLSTVFATVADQEPEAEAEEVGNHRSRIVRRRKSQNSEFDEL